MTADVPVLERREDFVDNASLGLHCVDADGIIVWANQTELEFLGYSYEQYVGRPIADFHVDDAVIGNILNRLIAGQTLNAYPARLHAKDGTQKFVLINSNVFRSNGTFCHTRCFTTQISESAWTLLRAQACRQDPNMPPLD